MIEQAFIIAMVCQAVSASFCEGMIFEKPGAWLESNYHKLWKPAVGCPVCMSFWYGLVLVLIMGWPFLAIPISMGINAVVSEITGTLWNRD